MNPYNPLSCFGLVTMYTSRKKYRCPEKWQMIEWWSRCCFLYPDCIWCVSWNWPCGERPLLSPETHVWSRLEHGKGWEQCVYTYAMWNTRSVISWIHMQCFLQYFLSFVYTTCERCARCACRHDTPKRARVLILGCRCSKCYLSL